MPPTEGCAMNSVRQQRDAAVHYNYHYNVIFSLNIKDFIFILREIISCSVPIIVDVDFAFIHTSIRSYFILL